MKRCSCLGVHTALVETNGEGDKWLSQRQSRRHGLFVWLTQVHCCYLQLNIGKPHNEVRARKRMVGLGALIIRDVTSPD